jgi:hypothetical protein
VRVHVLCSGWRAYTESHLVQLCCANNAQLSMDPFSQVGLGVFFGLDVVQAVVNLSEHESDKRQATQPGFRVFDRRTFVYVIALARWKRSGI